MSKILGPLGNPNALIPRGKSLAVMPELRSISPGYVRYTIISYHTSKSISIVISEYEMKNSAVRNGSTRSSAPLLQTLMFALA